MFRVNLDKDIIQIHNNMKTLVLERKNKGLVSEVKPLGAVGSQNDKTFHW